MKNNILFSLGFLILTFFFQSAGMSISSEVHNKLTQMFQNFVEESNIPGLVVGINVPGKDEWLSVLGVSDKKTKKKMQLNDHFRIGSVTKTFVATGILQLSDKGKLSLDDKVEQYVKNVPNGDKITIRQLANMTSGLPSYSQNKTWAQQFLENPQRVWTPEELLKAAFSVPILFKPGEKFHYCNTNYILLGLIIEKASGMPLGSYLEKNIFEPLNLKNTSFPLTNAMPDPFSHGYTKQTLTGQEKDMTFQNPSWAWAAGGMISNLDDLKIWAEALGTGKLLSKEAFKERTQWVAVSSSVKDRKYGLGVGFDKGWLMHAGELPGYNSIVAYLPEQKVVMVLLVNSDIPTKEENKEVSPAPFMFESVSKILFPENIPSVPKS